MTATTTPTRVDLDDARVTEGLRAALVGDTDLAHRTRDTLRALAAHSPAYVAVFQSTPGARLAADLNGGLVASLTPAGRAAMERTYVRATLARLVEPGLDTNTLVDRITGRMNPRTAHLGERSPAEVAADAADRHPDPRWSTGGMLAALDAVRPPIVPEDPAPF